MARRYGSTGTTRRTGGTTSTRRDAARPPAPDRGDGGWREELLGAAAGPVSWLTREAPWKPVRTAGNVLGTIGTSPLQALLYPKETVSGARTALYGLWEGPLGIGKSVRDIGFQDTAGLLWEGMKADYKSRYGDDWEKEAKKNGLFNLFDALAVLGVGVRGATMAGAYGRLSAADKGVTFGNVWKESRRPGLISEGEARTRRLTYQPETGKAIESIQPYSRSPLRRASQDLSDILAERFGDAPIFGARSRISRAQGSQLRRTMERTLGGVVGEEALNGLGVAGRSRLFWESQLGTADNATLLKLRKALAEEYDSDFSDVKDPDFADWLRGAKQAGFGGQLLKRLDAAIEYQPGKRYERAKDAMRQATELSERTIEDANGFTSLTADLKRVSDRIDGLEPGSKEYLDAITERTRLRAELHAKSGELQSMFRNRRNILRDWLDTKGDNEHSRAWMKALVPIIGQDQATQAVALAHAMANKIRPDNPESWWADKVGMPSKESAAMFRERVGEDVLFQFGDDSPGLLDSGFYSPAQKWADENFTEPMAARELERTLREEIPDEEFYNSGLDMWFKGVGADELVNPQEFKLLLANRVNAYNLRQVIRTNTEDSFQAGLPTFYDRERGEGTYISREPGEGEYFEVTFELPGPGRDEPFMDVNKHWQRENVAVHFRFHIFEEDGVRKLLVEEIQSDWTKEALKQRQEGRVYRRPTPDEQKQIDDLTTEIEQLTARQEQLTARQRELEPLIESVDGDPDAESEWYRNQDVIDSLNQDWWELNEGFRYYNDMFGLGNIPPAPLGKSTTSAKSSYLNAPVRWIARHAVENDVDEVILIGREQQLLRNQTGFDPRVWLDLRGPGRAQEITDYLRENPVTHNSFKSYEKDIPKIMGREFGVVGRKVDDAYTGEYRVFHDTSPESRASGRMPGTVFKVDDAFRAEAMKPKSMYQRTPDWDALPKGAVELFAGGKSRIHIFKGGDASTWIHELGHVALGDLGPEDLRVIEGHFGGGKAHTVWTEMQHEDFARAFEQYVREGVAPTRALEPIFARISAWIRAVWEREKRVNQDIPPEVSLIFSKLFRSENEPDIFIPHRATAPDLMGGRTTRGIPRANREIGDRTFSRVPLFKKNTLGLMKAGLLNDDPRMLMEHTNRVVALARANQLRETVLEMGTPLLPGDYPDFDTQYVVKRAGRGVDKPTFDALESADNPEEIRTTVKDFIDNHITDESQKYEAWKGEGQLYVVDKKVVDMLFKYVTGKTPGAATKPATNSAKVLDATLDSIRGLLLYANPGFYVTNLLGNTGMMMLSDPRAAKYLPWSMKQAVRAASRPESADSLWQRISVEMGRGPTSGSFSMQPKILSPEPGSEGNVLGRTGEYISSGLGEYGRRSGRIIDDSFRVSAWRQAAAKQGYTTDAQVQKLLDDRSIERPFKGKATQIQSKAEKDLAAIRDEAEQLMLDFDSMSPFERTYLQRMIFLYPFLKASAKYPVMFAGERPVVSGALMEAGAQGERFAEQEDVFGPRPELPDWLSGYARGPGGYVNVGSFSPFNMPPELIQSLINIRGPAEPGVQRPWDYANPFYQLVMNLARQQNEYGRDVPTEDILRNEFPLPAWMRYPLRKPSTRYKERDFWNTLLRSLRVAPTGINEGEMP